MRVDSKNDFMESPEECSYCGTSIAVLERCYFFGPGHNVDWLCPYCSVAFGKGENQVTNSMANMFNLLEERLKDSLKCK